MTPLVPYALEILIDFFLNLMAKKKAKEVQKNLLSADFNEPAKTLRNHILSISTELSILGIRVSVIVSTTESFNCLSGYSPFES